MYKKLSSFEKNGISTAILQFKAKYSRYIEKEIRGENVGQTKDSKNIFHKNRTKNTAFCLNYRKIRCFLNYFTNLTATRGYSHSLLLNRTYTILFMRFSSDYLDCFHYPDSWGYLIICCHCVATRLIFQTPNKCQIPSRASYQFECHQKLGAVNLAFFSKAVC